MVPYVTETTPRGERTMDIYSQLSNDRIIFLGTPLDDQVANAVMAQMLHLASEDSDQDINLYINSPVGSVPGMLAIQDTINFVSCDVATTAMGFAASALAFLLMSGTKGKRHALPNTRIVLHKVLIQGGLGGQASDVEIQANELVYNKRRVNEITRRERDNPSRRSSATPTEITY
jgi:ATP-dependent Clp protease, protease subunit